MQLAITFATIILSLALATEASPVPRRRASDNGYCKQLLDICAASPIENGFFNPWSVKACLFGAGCFGGQPPVDGFLSAVASAYNASQGPASHDVPRVSQAIFNSISTNGKAITQQNYIDGVYGTLATKNGPFPDASFVIQDFSRLAEWTAFCSSSGIPFKNFADYYQFSATVNSPGCNGAVTTIFTHPDTTTPPASRITSHASRKTSQPAIISTHPDTTALPSSHATASHVSRTTSQPAIISTHPNTTAPPSSHATSSHASTTSQPAIISTHPDTTAPPSSHATSSHASSTTSQPATITLAPVNGETTCAHMFNTCIAQTNQAVSDAWSHPACLFAATCFGGQRPVDGLLAAVFSAKESSGTAPTGDKETLLSATTLKSISTDGETITQQNWIDGYYGLLSSLGGPLPTSASVVIDDFTRVRAWTGYCTGGIPFKNVAAYFELSSVVSTNTSC